MSDTALRTLLAGSIDYAGLFPPAGLDMAASVRQYADYRSHPDAWALGRFVVPAARLTEFEQEAALFAPASQPLSHTTRLTWECLWLVSHRVSLLVVKFTKRVVPVGL